MTLEELISAEIPLEKFELLSKEELIQFARGEQHLRLQMQRENDRLRAQYEELKQRSFLIEDQLVSVKNKIFCRSSEKSPPASSDGGESKKKKFQKSRVLLPSQRYPDAMLIERHVELEIIPSCGCCQAKMQDSGMTQDSEFLTVIPEQYLVIRQKRHKYRCGKCHGDIKTAPAPPRIKDGSSYSDEMMIDVALSKYCDLIPVERYAQIAKRAGLKDLPPQSLIEMTHNLSDFSKPAYEKLKIEIQKSSVLSADETPHRMLEGSSKANWYLWGFSTPKTSYFEIHDTRSGQVASTLLVDSSCKYLVSDVFSGYGKAVRDINKVREIDGREKIRNSYCNAHARRKFKEALDRFPDDAQFFIDQYKEIYRIEAETKMRSPNERVALRAEMKIYFNNLKLKSMADIAGFSSKSSLGRAMSYFLENFEGLTLFLQHNDLPIDNNSQERLLRSPVVGRKTWYGTHSERGAETAAVLFSLVESCKLNKINPREYFKKLVQDLHQKKSPMTPSEFSNLPI